MLSLIVHCHNYWSLIESSASSMSAQCQMWATSHCSRNRRSKTLWSSKTAGMIIADFWFWVDPCWQVGIERPMREAVRSKLVYFLLGIERFDLVLVWSLFADTCFEMARFIDRSDELSSSCILQVLKAKASKALRHLARCLCTGSFGHHGVKPWSHWILWYFI